LRFDLRAEKDCYNPLYEKMAGIYPGFIGSLYGSLPGSGEPASHGERAG
jgi:hypothetical protein